LRVMFVCSLNAMRSPTAEVVFSGISGIEATSAGTDRYADMPVSAELIEWAEIILVMETRHKKKLQEQFGAELRTKTMVVLGIPDLYRYMSPELVTVLKRKVPKHPRVTPEQMVELDAVGV
jgi:predicted protein tyrosine phosphatase